MGLGDWLTGAADAINRAINPIWWFDDPTEERPGEAPGTTHVPAPLQPLESTLSSIAWLKDNGVSRPITTANLMAQKVLANPLGSEVISGEEWSKSWSAAKAISPLQGFLHGKGPQDLPMLVSPVGQIATGLFDKNRAEQVRKIEQAPLEYKRPENLPPEFDQMPWEQQQQALKDAGMPVQGNWEIQQERNRSLFFKYATGIGDFALSWYADPLVLTGKIVGAAKTATITRPVTASWDTAKINAELNRDIMAKTQQYMWANKDNPLLLNQLPIASKSALGPRFGAITSTLKDMNEVNTFLRVGLGDVNAFAQLKSANVQAGAMIEQDLSRLAAMDLLKSRFANNPGMLSLVVREHARLEQAIASNVDMVQRYEQILDSYHLIDQIGMTRFSFARAEQQTAAAAQYEAGAARRAGQTGNRSFLAQRSFDIAPRQPGQPFVSSGVDAQKALNRPVRDPLPGGAQTVATRIYNSFFGTPLTVIRSFGEYRPNGHINVGSLDADSIKELRGFVARIPGSTARGRQNVVNAFIKAKSEGERANIVDGVQQQAMRAIAKRHGFSMEDADALWKEHQLRQGIEKQNMYSTIKMPGAEPGQKIRVDVFEDGSGGLTVHPNMVSKLINSQQMVDLDVYDKLLARHGSALKALRLVAGSSREWLDSGADYLNKAWKFGTLLRLGYIPRVLGDDLAGQMARLGAATMAARAGYGVKNLATNMARASRRSAYEARVAANMEGVQYADDELLTVSEQIAQAQKMHAALQSVNQRAVTVAQNRVARATARHQQLQQAGASTPQQAARIQAAQTLVQRHTAALTAATYRAQTGLSPGKLRALQDLQDQHQFLTDSRLAAQQEVDKYTALLNRPKVIQGQERVDIAPGVALPGAFEGERGLMYQESISSEDSLNNVFMRNKQLLHGNLMRTWDHGAVVSNASVEPERHLAAWQHVINAQFGNDQLARRALAGDSVDEMRVWLSTTAEGIVYRRRLGENLTSAEDLARRVHYEVNEITPTPELRAKALTPDGVSTEDLADQFPDPLTRPDVHRAQIAAKLAGSNDHLKGLNTIMDKWFRFAASLPADRMSRHPLFNQLYAGHARRIAGQEAAQGVVHTAADAERLAETARRLALRDTRKLVFDIAHRSDAGAALRFMSPFFSATTEAWQRWARIIAEKPEVAGYYAKFLNAPLAMGVVQDQDGNKVDSEGYAFDPVTKTRTLVPKSDRRIIMRLPKFMVAGPNPIGLALGASEDGRINLSQDSMNLVLQGDPWFNPGVGPIVSIPVSTFVEDKPDLAKEMRTAGILPFGPSTSTAFGSTWLGQVADQALPRTLKNFLTAWDTSDNRYQQVKAQIMQRAAFEHANLGKPMPSAQEIADRTRNYWLFSAMSAFLGPVASQTDDPYQFYRDEYNKMNRMVQTERQKQGQLYSGPSADDMFLDKYGESYFVFAQTMSKNLSGLPATENAIRLQQKYGSLIEQSPELAALIIGPEGNGPFSPEAYAYQLNTPLIPGGAEMQRTRITADEAMKENERRLGWAKFTAKMNQINSQLVARGLSSFDDSGAEDLKRKRQNYIKLYSSPLKPDGSTNPKYLKAWAEDYNTLDRTKYDKLIPAMESIVASPLAQDSRRTDLQQLSGYLKDRRRVMTILADRKRNGGSATLTAKSNSDLMQQWTRRVSHRVLADTSFGDLYHRYLSRDLGVDVAEQMELGG